MTERQPTDHQERLATGMSMLVIALCCLAVLVSPAPYLHDFAEWLYQSEVLKLLLVDPGAVPGYSLNTYPVPNSLVVATLAALGWVLPPPWAGKLFLVSYLLLWYAVIRRIADRMFEPASRASSTFLLLATLPLATFFWYGFVSYQLGLLLFAWFLSLKERDTSPATILAFSIALFFTHGMMFLVFALYVGIQALTTRTLRVTALALAPAGLLSAWFLLGRHLSGYTAPVADAAWSGLRETVIYKLGYPAMLGPFKNLLREDGSSLLESLPSIYWAGFVTNFLFVVSVALFVLYVGWRTVSRQDSWAALLRSRDGALLLTASILAILYVVAPYNFFGLFNPGGRLLLPLFLMAVLVGRRQLRAIAKPLFWPLAAFTLLTCGSYLYLVYPQGDGYRLETAAPRHSELPGDSVLAFNRALYANTRFHYFNYRIFAFAHRYEQLEHRRYSGLGLRVGVISWRKPAQDPQQGPGPSKGQLEPGEGG